MSKTKQFRICAICGEPAAMSELTSDGLCPETAKAPALTPSCTTLPATVRLSPRPRNNANADVLNPNVRILYLIRPWHRIKASPAVSHQGNRKDRTNQQQGPKFRGIDDVMNELHSLFAAMRSLSFMLSTLLRSFSGRMV